MNEELNIQKIKTLTLPIAIGIGTRGGCPDGTVRAKGFHAYRFAIMILLLLMLIPNFLEAQCAMCRAVLESSDSQEVAKGINNGIIFLMAIPYILVATLGYFIFRMLKKKEDKPKT